MLMRTKKSDYHFNNSVNGIDSFKNFFEKALFSEQ